MTSPGIPEAMHWQAILEVGPDECHQGEAALDPFCDAIAILPVAAGWRLEGLLRPDLDPVDLSDDWSCLRLGNDDWCPPTLRVVPLPDRDWVAVSQQHLCPVNVGRFTIYGTHDRSRIRPGPCNILIDAGQAFGTGHHASSRGCLMALERLLPRHPDRILDFGCGSGLLAIAAARSGHARVVAVDHDPLAVAETYRNAMRNHVGRRIQIVFNHRQPMILPGHRVSRKGGGFRSGSFDLTLANILADPLVTMAADLAHSLKPGGFLILSGFLSADYRRVQNAYLGRGLHLFGRIVIEDWVTLIMRRRRKN